jgi:hypothetical protein
MALMPKLKVWHFSAYTRIIENGIFAANVCDENIF